MKFISYEKNNSAGVLEFDVPLDESYFRKIARESANVFILEYDVSAVSPIGLILENRLITLCIETTRRDVYANALILGKREDEYYVQLNEQEKIQLLLTLMYQSEK